MFPHYFFLKHSRSENNLLKAKEFLHESTCFCPGVMLVREKQKKTIDVAFQQTLLGKKQHFDCKASDCF